MNVRGAAVGRVIEYEHEATFREQFERGPDAHVSMKNSNANEELLIGHRAGLCTGRVQTQTFEGYLPPIHVQHKVVETYMAEDVAVSVRRSRAIGVSKHREKMAFWWFCKHCVFYQHGFRARLESECLERHSVHVSDIHIFQGFVMSQLNGGRRFQVSRVQRGFQKLADCPDVGLGTQGVKVALGLREINLKLHSDPINRGTLTGRREHDRTSRFRRFCTSASSGSGASGLCRQAVCRSEIPLVGILENVGEISLRSHCL